jgi:hypothetical protein
MPSHKTLKSVVRNMAQSFTSLMNYRGDDYVMGHLVYAAWDTGGTECRVDLLSGKVYDSTLLVPFVRDSIESYVSWFPQMVKGSNSDMSFVKKAELLITIDPNTRRPHAESEYQESPYTCTVCIIDDRGKQYQHSISDWWYPERTPPRAKKRRWWQLKSS